MQQGKFACLISTKSSSLEVEECFPRKLCNSIFLMHCWYSGSSDNADGASCFSCERKLIWFWGELINSPLELACCYCQQAVFLGNSMQAMHQQLSTTQPLPNSGKKTFHPERKRRTFSTLFRFFFPSLSLALVWLRAGSYFILSVKRYNEKPPAQNGWISIHIIWDMRK